MADIKLIVGNWKMNGLKDDSRQRTQALLQGVAGSAGEAFKMVLCPPALWIGEMVSLTKDSGIAIGGQDCHAKPSGAFTGNIAAVMLKEAGCEYVILGHSERRQYHAETDSQVAEKARAAHAAGLVAIVCVGELEADRDAGMQNAVVGKQLAEALPEGATAENTVVAYEPVWAIGTGKTASVKDVEEMHAFIRSELNKKISHANRVSILYGGSVKSSNALEILQTKNVDGVLVGGASLQADEFLAIARAGAAAAQEAA